MTRSGFLLLDARYVILLGIQCKSSINAHFIINNLNRLNALYLINEFYIKKS